MSSYGRAQIIRPSLKELADIKRNQMCQEVQKDICSVVNKMNNLGKAIVDSQKRINQLISKEKERRKELEKIDIELNQIEEKYINRMVEAKSEELNKYQQKLDEKNNLIKQAKNEIEEINLEILKKKAQDKISNRKFASMIETLKRFNDELNGKITVQIEEILKLKEMGDLEKSYHKALSLLTEGKGNKELKSEKLLKLIELKERILSEFETIIFYSDQVENEFKNKIKKIEDEIVNHNYESALFLSSETLKELILLSTRKDSSEFKSAEKELLLLNRELEEYGDFIRDEIKEYDLSRLKMLLDSGEISEFKKSINNIRKKMDNKFNYEISSTIREVMIDRTYDDISVLKNRKEETEVTGYKNGDPLIFWIKKSGEIEFDFSEDALGSDNECHKEIKEFLLALREKLKRRGINIKIAEIMKKYRKDKKKEIVEKAKNAIKELGYKGIEIEETSQGLEIRGKKVDEEEKRRERQRSRRKVRG